ncbi:ubiquinol-cytochrome C chaperone family protein [uncultured Alsobacter sp.]|uniref:ubiquinol-cytochrome C chaperone family protein n=1 Tax=uncultured Alsobacter sp. TaxID=1748258 RepID=UPI0025EA59E9|nr:ubiquinol-cytochrome C chaperone family protein [uncultured Alsobacter sp.]
MIFNLFRRRGNAAIVDGLYLAVAEASRRPAFYAGWGVPDTVEGRFEMLTLHVVLLLRRLKALPPPAGDLAQDLVDAVFAQFDRALRELGVGDLTVPKRMKTMASAFYGRAKAYEDAFADDGELAAALARNLFGPAEPAARGTVAVQYVRSAAAALERTSFDDIVAARLSFPEPGSIEGVSR